MKDLSLIMFHNMNKSFLFNQNQIINVNKI